MPGRKTPIITGNFYHVFNRGVAKMPTFRNKAEYERAIELINYYRFANVPIKYSLLLDLPHDQQYKIMKNLEEKNEILVEIHSFILMFNHFHFILKQITDNGISKFIADFTNSYTRYVNTKDDRVGPIFQGTFKSVPVESDEQMLHLSRYQHLNLYTDGVVDSLDALEDYLYSSLQNYLGKSRHGFVNTDFILSFFKNTAAYKKFVFNYADYQKNLGKIKHHMKKLGLKEKSKIKKLAKIVPKHL